MMFAMDLKGVKMKTFNALFYRPDFDGKLLDNSILACTLPYNPAMWNKKSLWTSHAEIQIDDMCFTSTMGQSGGKNRPKEDGVVCRPASQVIKYDYRWYYYPIYVSSVHLGYMQGWMKLFLESNKGYNKGDIADFFNPIKRQQDLSKWICSGITWACICCAMDSQNILPKKEAFGHSIKELPSPLRLSHWLLKAPKDIVGNPVDLATGKELYQKAA
jgi:hypothetical protein